jgi:hypothetical protein
VDYQHYGVNAKDRKPLLDFMLGALEQAGCVVMKSSDADEAPFRISFATPTGERLGIIAYAFLANTKLTKNRPDDEHRFQVKYGSKDGRYHEIFQDPFGLYTTLFVGINPEKGIFVGADPEMHNPTRFFISVEFKQSHVDEIVRTGWHSWERETRNRETEPVEVLVGGTAENFLRYVRFERAALREDQGHRQLLAEKIASDPDSPLFTLITRSPTAKVTAPSETIHALSQEFEMPEAAVLDLIASAPRLKMAVRGWVAEEKLVRTLEHVSGVSNCVRVNEEGGPDVRLRFEGSRELTVQCKNVLRQTTKKGEARVDFQKTRASKSDPCSRYYRVDEFDLVAACLHAITTRWEFQYVLPRQLEPHPKCQGRLSNNVRVDDRWTRQARDVLAQAAHR